MDAARETTEGEFSGMEAATEYAVLLFGYEAGVLTTPITRKNITTLKDFDSKWKDMLEAGEAQLLEGAGYQSKGVYRPAPDCRMHTNTADCFCPVCQRAISRVIEFYINSVK